MQVSRRPLLHFVTNGVPRTVRDWDIVRQAIRGGAAAIQLRAQSGERERDVYYAAKQLKGELIGSQTSLIINNYTAIAKLVGAGLHVGQGDLPYPAIRELLGPNALIGLSIETEEQAKEAQQWPLDYIGVGAFPSTTKPDFQPLGLDGIARLRSWWDVPIIGIGGITIANASSVVEAGANGVAVVGAIAHANDPAAAAQQLTQAMHYGLSF